MTRQQFKMKLFKELVENENVGWKYGQKTKLAKKYGYSIAAIHQIIYRWKKKNKMLDNV